MKLPEYYFVFDVESIGLFGEAFSVGFVVFNRQGKLQEELELSCNPDSALGEPSDRIWVEQNCLVGDFNCSSPVQVCERFLDYWKFWKKKDAILIADCCFPVETNFLCDCLRKNPENRLINSPYPLYDLSSFLFAYGCDPLAEYDRTENELPKHNSLNDARQSARLFKEIVLKLK